jgi:hypothetical protein
MSKSVIRKNQFSGVNSPQTPHDDQHIQLDGQVGSFSVTMKTTTPQSAPAIDSHPAFSLWWERWRREARTRVSPPPSIGRHSYSATEATSHLIR